MVKFDKKGVQVSPLFCDKLAFVIQYKTTEERNYVRDRLKNLKYDSHGQYAHDGGKRKYKIGMYLYVELYEMVNKLLIQADPKTYSDHFLRVDYNPAHADPGTVFWLLNQVLPGGWLDIATRATCTRFDATVDVTGIAVEELLVCYSKMQRSRVFCKGGKTQTYELGAYDGDKHVVVYDKCAEIEHWNLKHAINEPVPTGPVARLEVVLRPSIMFDKLIQLGNQFTGLNVYATPPLPEATTLLFRLFVEVARLRGLHDALLMLPEGTRKQFKTLLEKSACSWWDPEPIWAGWIDLVLDLLQAQIQVAPAVSALATKASDCVTEQSSATASVAA